MTYFFHYLIRNQFSKRTKYLKSSAAQPHQSSSHEEHDEQRQHADAAYCTTITDLPSHILIDILSRLPLKEILILRANFELFLRTDYSTCISKTLHWVDVESLARYHSANLSINRRGTKINTRLYLPKRFHSLKDKKRGERGREYEIVNSCNGFLCLRKPFFKNPCIICNPLTGEYITIPKPENDDNTLKTIISGFGYSLKSKQYKVVRLVFNNFLTRTAEVYTLGTATWRKVGNAPWSTVAGLFATYLNGVIHWVCDDIDDHGSDFIVGFDFEDERFCEVPAPPHFDEKQKTKDNLCNMSLGVLGGYLSVCDVTYFTYFDVWVMKDYGVQESWTKWFTVDNSSLGLCRPLKYLSNGYVLMFYKRRALVLYNPVEKNVRYILINEAQSVGFEAITNMPSFLSLKDVVGGDCLEIQNVNSRSAESELQEEAETLFLVEETEPAELLSELGVVR
ncbi:F-box protein [Melia azedarach]|uniref:F-box protein n=1 Tax=Melia azedarach TaxID=155640 RepID=A0ACC1XXY1_MELAZ|nr:F-box protein [Melia azedarach]